MRHYLVWTALLATICFINTTELLADKLSDLRVSENGRFLVRKDAKPLFLLGDSAWSMPWKLNRSEVLTYLQHRKAHKFNAIGVIAFCPWGTDANAYDDKPFQVKNGEWDPMQPITKSGNAPDNSTEYDYWDHLEYIIEQANQNGMYVFLNPVHGDHVTGSYGGDDTSRITFNTTNAYAYGRWVGDRYRNKQNIIWMIGGDRSAVYGNKDYRPVFRAVAEGVADGVNGVNNQNGQADYSTTLMSYWPRKRQPNSSEWFHKDPWLDFNSIQDTPEDQVPAIENDYGLSPIKPTWLFEPRYEEAKNRPNFKDYQLRFQVYQGVFAGGFGCVYGHGNIWPFGKDRRRNHPGDSELWQEKLNAAGALDMQHLWCLMTSLSKDQFFGRIPDQSLIEGDQGTTRKLRSSRLQATRGRKGDYAMIYSANGRNIRVKMNRLAAPLMNAFWFNPRDGKWRTEDRDFTNRRPFVKNIPSGSGAPIREFDPPGSVGNGNDWVLVLTAGK